MQVVTIKNNQIPLPKDIVEAIHLKDGKKAIVEIIDQNTIQVRIITPNIADQKIRKSLESGYHMGKIKDISREAIYNDIN